MLAGRSAEELEESIARVVRVLLGELDALAAHQPADRG